MNEEIMKQVGYIRETSLVRNKKCPLCECDIIMSDFRDNLSIREYKISGLCQACQDEIFEEAEYGEVL
jgi:hypothetical protein